MDMKPLICFKHPHYKGDKSPDLKCKACCAVFVQKVRMRSSQQTQDITSWLESHNAKDAITWTI